MKYRGRFSVADGIVAFACILLVLMMAGAVGQSGREQAKRAVCQVNLRQLITAWTCYADDNEGNLINGDTAEYDGHTNETPWVLSDWLISMTVAEKELSIRQGVLFPYTQDVRLYRCPLGSLAETRTYTVVDSMNVHSWLSRATLKRFDEIQHPDRRFVFLDDGGTAHIAMGGWSCYPDGTERWWDPPAIRHNDGTTLSFADGHVEYKQWEDPRTIESGRTMTALSELQPGNKDIQYMYDGVWGPATPAPTGSTPRR